MRYSERWRHLRKMFHQFFRQGAIPIHHRYISRMATSLVSDFLKTPENFEEHVRDYAGIIVLHLAYGYETQSDHAEYMTLAKDSAESLRLTSLGNFLYLPAWLPGVGFKNKAKDWAMPVEAIRIKPFDFFKRTMKDLPVEEQEALIRITVSLILSWMMVMSNHPDIQARAQDEIQRVIGTSRLPSLDDKGSLPYVEAVITETLRWSAITPLAIPHRALNDDVYEGYRIPGGATVIGNTWAMLHDEEIYPNPYKFDPERFLGDNKAPDPTPLLRLDLADGRYLALSSSWIAITLILSTLNLRKAIDADGNEVHVPVGFLDGIIWCLSEFVQDTHHTSLPEAIDLIRNQNRGGIEADD
ncbi:cytochrome P450 [Infundibulicybe gibba]|nr:cytochrome P450 [Infundibulicybe gibba]